MSKLQQAIKSYGDTLIHQATIGRDDSESQKRIWRNAADHALAKAIQDEIELAVRVTIMAHCSNYPHGSRHGGDL